MRKILGWLTAAIVLLVASAGPVAAGPTSPPETVPDQRAIGGYLSVHLTWGVPSSDTPLLRYTVYQSTPTGWAPIAVLPPDRTSHDLSAEPDVYHYFSVTASNAFGESSMGRYTWAEPFGPEPNAPYGVTAELHGADVEVTWRPDDRAPFTSHRVYRGGELLAELPAEAVSWTDTQVSYGTHHYQVASVNEHGEGARSGDAVIVPTPPDPRAPQDLELAWDGGHVVLTWQPPSGPSGQVARYVVYRSSCDQDCKRQRIGTTTRLTHTDRNPPSSPCSGVWYQVAALDDEGETLSTPAGYGEGTNC